MSESMSRTRRALGLRAYLNLALAVTVVIFALASAFTYTQVESRIRADVWEHLDTLAASSAGDIATWLEQKRSVARALATYPAMRKMQVDEAQRIVNATYAAAPADYNNIGLFDATGLMVADIAGGAGKSNLIKGNSWGPEVYAGRRNRSPELLSSLNNRPIMALYERVMDASGAVVGVVGVGTDLTAISERLEEPKIGQTGEAVLVNSQGLVLNRLRHKPDSILTLDLSKDRLTLLALSGQTGVVEMADYRGVPVIAAYRPIPQYGWGLVVKQDADEAFAVLAELRAVFFGIIVGALAIALVSNLIVQRRVSLALARLIVGSQRFAAGEFATPIEPLAIGEFAHLADEFNRMAAALSEKEAQLRGYAGQLERRVQERTTELEAANKELEAFSYSVSHDLRAPLRAIDGFSRILMEEYAPQLAPEPQRYLKLVRDNTRQMGNLVDDLLTFSRLSRQPLRKQSVKTTALVRQALDELRAETNGRQVEFAIGEMHECQADPNLLKQVWINLLSNALKFTRQRDPARIEIGWKKENDEQVYFVKDNGVGFDMKYTHKLFGVFQRLHRSEEYEGTGVGLAIVQRIVHRHGGRVWAEGQVDDGATFYFSLPFVEPAAPPLEPAAPPPVVEPVDELAERARELI